jgi:1,4-dihydroxy-2-naphthoate octaprenyltransferase
MINKWTIWATLFFIHSVFQLYKGVDRIDSYFMSETGSDLDKHVFVGGDAYNYIINANIQTGHFVLSASSFMAGIILISTGAIVKTMKENSKTAKAEVVAEENEEDI